MYIKEGLLNVEQIGAGSAWFDTGTFESLHEASSYIKTMQNRQSFRINCPEEVAWRKKWIDNKELYKLAMPFNKSGYGNYLMELISKS